MYHNVTGLLTLKKHLYISFVVSFATKFNNSNKYISEK